MIFPHYRDWYSPHNKMILLKWETDIFVQLFFHKYQKCTHSHHFIKWFHKKIKKYSGCCYSYFIYCYSYFIYECFSLNTKSWPRKKTNPKMVTLQFNLKIKACLTENSATKTIKLCNCFFPFLLTIIASLKHTIICFIFHVK